MLDFANHYRGHKTGREHNQFMYTVYKYDSGLHKYVYKGLFYETELKRGHILVS